MGTNHETDVGPVLYAGDRLQDGRICRGVLVGRIRIVKREPEIVETGVGAGVQRQLDGMAHVVGQSEQGLVSIDKVRGALFNPE